MESKRDQFTIVPVLVGALKEGKEAVYGKLFSQYLADPNNLFVVSSDFCHWGKNIPLSPLSLLSLSLMMVALSVTGHFHRQPFSVHTLQQGRRPYP